jgi:PAS domain-containing protein
MSREEDRSCVLVVDGTKLTGIFTERDVVKLTASGIDLSRTKISQAMVQPTISLTFDRNQNPLTALSFMRQHRIRNLPVVDDRDELVGLVTQERIYEAIELLERVEESGDRQKREIEQQFASLVENNPDIIFRLDLQLRHIYISPKVREASGLSPQDFLGKTGRELGLPADACDIFETACREAIATGA